MNAWPGRSEWLYYVQGSDHVVRSPRIPIQRIQRMDQHIITESQSTQSTSYKFLVLIGPDSNIFFPRPHIPLT